LPKKTRGIFVCIENWSLNCQVLWFPDRVGFTCFFSFETELPAGGIGKPVKKKKKNPSQTKQGMKTSYYSLVEIKARLF